MLKFIPLFAIAVTIAAQAKEPSAPGMDFGPLTKLVGTWKSVETGGVDVAPAQAKSPAGKGQPAVSPFYEIMTFEPAADATNASEQYLVALYYKQEVFRKSDNKKFHDQRGYLIYDKQNQMVYNSFCVPRAACVVAEGKAGNKMTLKAMPGGIAESEYLAKNGRTTAFSMTLDLSGDDLKYSQQTGLQIYNKSFEHIDSDALARAK
ncbi:MAG: FABP family protein [Proteobacteria bacterium]|nr:FABP family protein [Pseudomonadota bacterium]